MSSNDTRYPRRKHLPPIGSHATDGDYFFPKKTLATHRRLATRGNNGSQPTQFSYSNYRDHSEDIRCRFCHEVLTPPTLEDIESETILCLICDKTNRLPKHLLIQDIQE